jgi:AsmA protein
MGSWQQGVEMRKSLFWAGPGLVVVVLAVGLAWILTLSGWAEKRAESLAAATLDFTFAAGQGVHLTTSGGLALRFEDVTLAAVSDGLPPFIHAESLVVPVSFADLVAHRLDFAQASLDSAVINLAIGERGQVSWPSEPGRQRQAMSLDLTNATVYFSDARSGQALEITRADLHLDVSDHGEVNLNGTAVVGEALVKIDTYVKDMTRLTGSGSPVDISVSTPALEANFNGRLTTAGLLSLAGTASLSGADLRRALAWAGSPVGGKAGLGAFAVSGSLDATGRAYALRQAEISLDGESARGDLSLDLRGDSLRYAAVLTTPSFDLTGYLTPTESDRNDWGTEPLGFEALRGIVADLTLDTSSLSYGSLHLGAARLAASLAKGHLDVRLASEVLPQARLVIDGGGDVPTLAMAIRGKSYAEQLGQLVGIGWLEGAGEFDLALSATGRTQQEMISTLKGTANLVLGQGRIRGLDVTRSLSAVAREIQDGWPAKAGGSTPFISLSADMTAADGIISVKTLKLVGERLQMSATGDVDLLRRALDLRADPRLATDKPGEMIGLPVAVVVKGPWTAPRLYPDMADILAHPDAAYMALRAKGMPSFPAGN